ncbi:MAG: hypothetical protein PHF86_00960 [Candidatus Nanoarchaeia archaeon]|nr:hypothetical protein [Candidatus Nanoarchaeia archaeon]
MNYTNKKGNIIKIDDSKEITRGGEGKIISYNNDKVAKIYLPGIKGISEIKFNDLIVLSNLFVKPEELIYSNNKIAGFFMKYIPKDYFTLFAAFSILFAKKNNIDNKSKLKTCQFIINGVKEAHINNIVIGDLNHFNILINPDGDGFFIDVDSYGTPNAKHSGKQLPEVQDHFKGCVINKEADYYALATLIYNYLSNIHPYKGVHPIYKSLSERALHRIPVFDKTQNIKAPNFYAPITDKNLQNQFEEIFVKGERFPIELNKSTIMVIPSIPTSVTIKINTDLLITEVLKNTDIKFISNSRNKLSVTTSTGIDVYEASYKGFYKIIESFSLDYKIILTDKYLYSYHNGELNIVKDNINYKITNLKFTKNAVLKQYENILVVIDNGTLFTIKLDEVLNYQVAHEAITVFDKRFRKNIGLIQHVSGNTLIFYNYKGVLNTHLEKCRIHDISQIGNIIISHEMDKNGNSLFSLGYINNGKLERKFKVDSLCNVSTDFENLVIIPQDEKLSLFRYQDLSFISDIKCDFVSESFSVHSTQSGIFLSDLNNLWLVNKR